MSARAALLTAQWRQLGGPLASNERPHKALAGGRERLEKTAKVINREAFPVAVLPRHLHCYCNKKNPVGQALKHNKACSLRRSQKRVSLFFSPPVVVEQVNRVTRGAERDAVRRRIDGRPFR